MQLFRASPHAPGWSGNIHESKLSDIHRPTQSRLPMGRLKSYKYKKSAYGGKKSPARAGTKEIVNRLAVSSGNSVGVALSRRRYPQQDDGLLFFDGYYQIEYNAFG